MGKGSNERKNILSGVVAMGIATVVVKILSVLYKIPMLNTLGEEGMGYFNTAYTTLHLSKYQDYPLYQNHLKPL